MTGPYFVDANVFVCAVDPRDVSKRRRANAWLDMLWREQRGRTSAQVLSESYVALKRLARAEGAAEDVWLSVQKYFAWNPLAIDESVLRRAREIEQRYRISWWDCMVVAAAQLQDCALLLTEDLQDNGVYGTVTVRSPFTLEVREPAAPYAGLPRSASPHRPRGRPKRAVQESTQETPALLKILALGNRQIEEGKVVPAAEAVRRARGKIARR